MNTEHPMYRPRRKSHACVASLLVLSIIKSAIATAGSQSANPADSRSETVSTAGLDLSTADGVNVARDRVHHVARRLCLQMVQADDRSRRWNYLKCVDDAVANAMQQVNAPSRGAMAKATAEQRTER
ncbi:MAG: hypothetical protein JWN43_1511 [Gammaproteobacteria bacterium]|nr:hypothetical protein [Gammaproteobacteria bacterium]